MRLLAALAFLSLAACDTSTDLTRLDVSTLSHDPAELMGAWDLVSATSPGQVGPPTTSPADGVSYVFSADGTVVIDFYGETRTESWSVPDPDIPTLLVGDRREYFGVNGDRLYFDDRPADGSLSEFARR